jgi:hypothetical protein
MGFFAFLSFVFLHCVSCFGTQIMMVLELATLCYPVGCAVKAGAMGCFLVWSRNTGCKIQCFSCANAHVLLSK